MEVKERELTDSMELSSLNSRIRMIAPYCVLGLVQLISAAYSVLCEVIFVGGTSSTVFLFYQSMASTLSVGVLAFIFERKRKVPLTWKITGGIFLMALVGVTVSQILSLTALYYVTSTISSSVLNTTVVITYTLALLTRQEKLKFHSLWEYGKIFGIVFSVLGALTLILWHQSVVNLTTQDSTNWAIGLFMLIAGVVCSSVWYLMLEPMMRSYPAELSMTAIMMFFATIQIGLVAAILNHNASPWQLNWDLELLNIVVGGVLSTGLCNAIYAWCAGILSPVVLVSFSPLGTLFTTIAGIVLLGHETTPGSAIGSILIVVGLYMYLWSKYKEEVQETVHDDEVITPFLLHNQHSGHMGTCSKV